ncbi:ANTAR domain-containing protein [Lentzea sp. NPDC102401]|uniref:ANTAR domain-containing protein n=1 Tax=Lentzea sp. NPDC102401 TaxID=3364128 RepID=UPI00381D28E2
MNMLLRRRPYDADQAFTVLQEISQHTNVQLRDVAAIVVATGSDTAVRLEDEAVQAFPAEVRRTGFGGPFAGNTADFS